MVDDDNYYDDNNDDDSSDVQCDYYGNYDFHDD
jgi:hypothetical protein